MSERFDSYLTQVDAQIRWARVRPALRRELMGHLEEQRDTCLADGMDESSAELEALRQMGDPVLIGRQLDAVHRPQPQYVPLLLAVVLVKISAPAAMDKCRDKLLDLMGGQTDFRAAFSAVGRAVSGQGAVGQALNDAYTAVFGPQQTVPEGTADPAAYSAETTPGDVCLTQQVLGFAYANPLTGTVTDRFGYRQDPGGSGTRFHYGLDIAADEGAVITAFASGTVTAVGDSAELGNYVTVQHEGGFATLYAHCSRINASSGQSVRMGDPIAEVGDTGDATGYHLHFELHQNNIYLNPVYYVT